MAERKDGRVVGNQAAHRHAGAIFRQSRQTAPHPASLKLATLDSSPQACSLEDQSDVGASQRCQMFQRKARNVDIELGQPYKPPERLEGYPEFAEFVASDRDAAIYRKFERLSARNLLYQQSELHDLERQLEEIDREDAEDIENEAAQKSSVDWQYFVNDTSEQAHRHRTLQATIKLKLKEYRM